MMHGLTDLNNGDVSPQSC